MSNYFLVINFKRLLVTEVWEFFGNRKPLVKTRSHKSHRKKLKNTYFVLKYPKYFVHFNTTSSKKEIFDCYMKILNTEIIKMKTSKSNNRM